MVIANMGTIISELILIAGIALVLFVIFELGKLFFGIILNIILGFIAIFALNAIFGLGIAFSLIVIIITAIFGLPGVAAIVILHFLGITL